MVKPLGDCRQEVQDPITLSVAGAQYTLINVQTMIRNLASLLLIPAAMVAQSIEGDWNVKTRDVALEIHISKSGRGYTGQLRNMDHPEVALPLAGIVARGGRIPYGPKIRLLHYAAHQR